jgi:hypothetical protein
MQEQFFHQTRQLQFFSFKNKIIRFVVKPNDTFAMSFFFLSLNNAKIIFTLSSTFNTRMPRGDKISLDAFVKMSLIQNE